MVFLPGQLEWEDTEVRQGLTPALMFSIENAGFAGGLGFLRWGIVVQSGSSDGDLSGRLSRALYRSI